VGSDALVDRMDIGFGRIFTFELSITPTLPTVPFTTDPVQLPADSDVVAGTVTTFAETGWTTGNISESTSTSSTEEADVGDKSSVLTEMSSDSRECSESHSSAVISVISCLVLSP